MLEIIHTQKKKPNDPVNNNKRREQIIQPRTPTDFWRFFQNLKPVSPVKLMSHDTDKRKSNRYYPNTIINTSKKFIKVRISTNKTGIRMPTDSRQKAFDLIFMECWIFRYTYNSIDAFDTISNTYLSEYQYACTAPCTSKRMRKSACCLDPVGCCLGHLLAARRFLLSVVPCGREGVSLLDSCRTDHDLDHLDPSLSL